MFVGHTVNESGEMEANSLQTQWALDGETLPAEALRETEAFEGPPPLNLHLRKLTPTVMSLVATTVAQAR